MIAEWTSYIYRKACHSNSLLKQFESFRYNLPSVELIVPVSIYDDRDKANIQETFVQY